MTFLCIALALIAIDARYHTFDEVAYELDSISQEFPAITHLDTIGYTTTDSLPIFALKISDNAHLDEDEPAVLYVACHHAEEILGIEICMYMIGDLLTGYSQDSVRHCHWVNNREIWFVPLLNPDGHDVVMTGIDTVWRKNKRDNNNNGVFDLDFDGVDLNRNYNFHWTTGGSTDPSSEYYRGPATFSEGEARALRDLAVANNFTFCITYHSARTGLSEVIYFPWNAAGYYPPDFVFIREVADTMSKLIINDAGTGNYTALPGAGYDGRTRNWMYGVLNIFTYCIEVSTTTIQPGWMVDDICERNMVGAYYLLDRAEQGIISGCIYDSLTGDPISAEVIIKDYYDHTLPARKSGAQYGRFLRIVSAGEYELEVRKPGYVTKHLPGIAVHDTASTSLDIQLVRMEYTSPVSTQSTLLLVPNPVSDIIRIGSGQQSLSSLKIFDCAGRLIKQFNDPTIQPSNYVVWDCTDDQNRKIAQGIYYVVGESGENVITEKVVFVR
jgi:hypothetical protein